MPAGKTLKTYRYRKMLIAMQKQQCLAKNFSTYLTLYFPYKKGKHRFLSTCTRNDVNIDEISKDTNQLVISKSYKDNRVLKNLKVNSIWFQNEGAFPDNLQDIVKDFEDVVVFFDNDNPGITAAEKLVTLINDHSNKARMVYLDKELLS